MVIESILALFSSYVVVIGRCTSIIYEPFPKMGFATDPSSNIIILFAASRSAGFSASAGSDQNELKTIEIFPPCCARYF